MAVKMEIRISVRKLVESILRSGNIDNRRVTFSETAMQEGGRIHRMLTLREERTELLHKEFRRKRKSSPLMRSKEHTGTLTK